MKQTIYPKGYYSNQEACPKCDTTADPYGVKGNTDWIRSQRYMDNDTFKYRCSNCWYTWQESINSENVNFENNIVEEPNKLKNDKRITKLEKTVQSLESKVKILEEKYLSIDKNVSLDDLDEFDI